MNQSVLTEKLLGHATVNVFFTASISSLSICICFFLDFLLFYGSFLLSWAVEWPFNMVA